MSKIKRHGFLYGSTVLMASMIVVKIIGAVFKIPLTNILHESGMGYFNSAYTIYTTVYALTVTGLSTAVARMVAERVSLGQYRTVRRILRLSTAVFILMGLAGGTIIALSAKSFAAGIHSPNSYWTVVIIAPAILFCCLMASYRGYYEGLNNMVPTAVTQVVEAVVKLLTGLALAGLVMETARRQYELTGVVFGAVCNSMEQVQAVAIPFAAAGAMLGVSISTLVGFIYLFIRHKVKGDAITQEMLKNSPKAMGRRTLLKKLIKISLPITLGAVVLQLSALIDMVTIMRRLSEIPAGLLQSEYGRYVSGSETMHEFLYGCFTSVVTLFNLVPAFTNIFGKSALPNVTNAWTRADRLQIKRNIESVIRMTSLVAAPMAFGMAFMAKPVLQIVYRDLQGAVQVGAPMLAVLGVCAFCLALVTPLNAVFQGIGRMDLPVKYLIFGALLKFLLNVVLIGIPSINIMGAAYSTIACYGVIAILSLWTLRRKVNITLDFANILIKPIIAGIICGSSAFICNLALTKLGSNSIITLVSIGFGAICYLFCLGILKAFPKEDLKTLPGGNKILKTLEKIRFIR